MQDRSKSATAQLFLKGARVTSDFRDELFDAANRAGITPNEFCITAAAEKLAAGGRQFHGVFSRGDTGSLSKWDNGIPPGVGGIVSGAR